MPKVMIFAGVPGSGKTSVIKNLIKHLDIEKCSYVKVDVFFSEDEKEVPVKYKKTLFSQDICPDHYTASKMEDLIVWAEMNNSEYLIIETAGLCFRCSPYIKNGVAVAVIDAIGTDVRKLGPLINYADIVALTKYDLISQSERDIIKYRIKQMKKDIEIVEVNGISGEGTYELLNISKEILDKVKDNKFELRYIPPSSVCEFCYGCVNLEKGKRREYISKVLKIAKKIPKINCGACGYEFCNIFIRKVVEGKEKPEKCIFYEKD